MFLFLLLFSFYFHCCRYFPKSSLLFLSSFSLQERERERNSFGKRGRTEKYVSFSFLLSSKMQRRRQEGGHNKAKLFFQDSSSSSSVALVSFQAEERMSIFLPPLFSLALLLSCCFFSFFRETRHPTENLSLAPSPLRRGLEHTEEEEEEGRQTLSLFPLSIPFWRRRRPQMGVETDGERERRESLVCSLASVFPLSLSLPHFPAPPDVA